MFEDFRYTKNICLQYSSTKCFWPVEKTNPDNVVAAQIWLLMLGRLICFPYLGLHDMPKIFLRCECSESAVTLKQDMKPKTYINLTLTWWISNCLTHYSLVLLFYIPWKHQKIFYNTWKMIFFRGYRKATPDCNGLTS